jgi:Ala-tRNA(Pro) deacylase
MQLTLGAVTPFGILNDSEHRVHFYLDREFMNDKIGVHPNDNTATVWLQANDLIRLIQDNGSEAEFTEILFDIKVSLSDLFKLFI